MLRFSRSEILSSEKKTRIVDGPGAKAWLATMAQPASLENLVEITQVLHALGAQGAEESAPVLKPERKFAIADRIRGLVLPMLSSRTDDDRYSVLPLDDEFSRHFWATVETAAALRDAYAWLVSQLPKVPEPVDGAKPETLDAAASITSFVSGVGALQRALDVSAQTLILVQRAHSAVPSAMWERHCVLGQLVRDLDCQDVEITDVLRMSATKTCRAAFVLPIMIALADPASRNSAEFEVTRMAAQRWSAKVGFRLERKNEIVATPQRPVANPGPTATLGSFVLRFDTQSAMQSIDKRLEALAEGRTPREVGIGDMLRAPAARDLLLSLKQRWGAKAPLEIDSPDRAWRLASDAPVLVMVGMPSRSALENQSVVGAGLGVRGAQPTYAYHRGRDVGITQSAEQIERSKVDQLFENAETWTLAAESSDAVRCTRKYPRPRIGLQRLVGLKLGESAPGAPFLLGWVEALQAQTVALDEDHARHSSAHTVRVRLAPGLPQLITASIDDVEVERAFLVVPGNEPGANPSVRRTSPFVPMLSDSGLKGIMVADDGDGWEAVRKSPREYGLVLPLTTFRPARLVKAVRKGAVALLRLEELMMRGSDFDLVRFTLL